MRQAGSPTQFYNAAVARPQTTAHKSRCHGWPALSPFLLPKSNLRSNDEAGQMRCRTLEIHLEGRKRPIGAFFEDLPAGG
jgi:hypothetical protein